MAMVSLLHITSLPKLQMNLISKVFRALRNVSVFIQNSVIDCTDSVKRDSLLLIRIEKIFVLR